MKHSCRMPRFITASATLFAVLSGAPALAQVDPNQMVDA